MIEEFSRLGILLGEDALEILSQKHVMVFGLGGVGSFAAEALTRSGIGKLSLVDYDDIERSNLNRQIIALQNTIGRPKAQVAGERFLEINPQMELKVYLEKYHQGNKEIFFQEKIDYIIDAIDMVSSKIDLIMEADKRNIPIISAMGMGNKLDPTKIKIEDIYNTSVCPLARVMRKELRERGLLGLTTVYSDETPLKPKISISNASKREIPGSTAFVPPVAGMVMASKVVRDFIQL